MTTHARRQLSVAWRRYIAKGTMMRPPSDRAAELMLIEMPLLRLNHRDIKAAVLDRAGPLWDMPTTIPYMKTRNITLLV